MARIEVYDRNGRLVPSAGLTRIQRLKLAAIAAIGAAAVLALLAVAVTTVLLVAIPLLVVALLVTLRILWRLRRMGELHQARAVGRAPPSP
jgi:hypothetical protein